MLGPEQFCFYLILLDFIMQQRPDVQFAYIDFGCRLKTTWARYLRHLKPVSPHVDAGRASLQILVNWWVQRLQRSLTSMY